jgi:hypothetical protein
MPRKPKTEPTEVADEQSEPASSPGPQKPPSKLDILAGLLRKEGGATVTELCTATGWQTHSVRGAMSGALKKRGLVVTSTKAGDERRYAAQPEADAQ